MEKIIEKDKCSGCSACANICPNNAITMEQDKNGFYKPIINQNKCTNCGLCKKACPALNYTETNKNNPNTYAVWANDEIRDKSSSGGLFTILAQYVLSKNGVVVGAAFNDNWEVEHIIINNENDLKKLRGSKYVQSKISETLYRRIKTLLENNTYVLFSGCPCQVAGLKYYLKKEYENLILVDLLCSGTPSPKALKKYLAEISNDENILQINFRDKKKYGWTCSHITITTSKRVITDFKFMHSFLSKSISNECCSQCKFATLPRQSDITIADFWGIEKFKRNWNDQKGTSMFIANNDKGENLYKLLKDKYMRTEQVPIKYAMQKVLSEPFKANTKKRDKFFKLLEDKDFVTAYNYTFGKYNNIGIMNFWYVPNRGAILTNYALNEFLKEAGYNAKTINYYPRIERKLHKKSISEKFEKKYLSLTKYCKDYIDLKSLNHEIGTFIVGSDQVFRDWCVHHHRDKYFLNFATEDAKKIACAASFGIPYYDGPIESKNIMQKYLQRFDAISTRETNGVDILKKDFNIEGTQIFDPVFFINKEKYEKIAKTSKKKEKNFLAYYIISMTDEKKKAIEYTANKLGLKAIDIKGKLPVEDWLYYIKNCSFYIGDSFHGTCFAIIFQKDFFVISPLRGNTDPRLNTLLEKVNLSEHQIKIAHEIYTQNDLLNKIDYTNRLTELNTEITRSKNWLIEAIEKEKQKTSRNEFDSLFFAQMDRLNIECAENTRRIEIINNKTKIYYEYWKCKILKKLILKKKKREYYKKKYKTYKLKIAELNSLYF